jgi:hypothetical protein
MCSSRYEHSGAPQNDPFNDNSLVLMLRMPNLRIELSVTREAKPLYAFVEVDKEFSASELVEWFRKAKKEGVFLDKESKLWISDFIVSVENYREANWGALTPIVSNGGDWS